MSRIISKDEFKASMRFAAAEEEANKIEKTEKPEKEQARKKPGPKPGSKKRKTATQKATVAADQKSKIEEEADIINIQVIEEALSKAAKQEKAIKAAVKLMTAFTQFLLKEAKDRIEAADRWADYAETLEDML